VTLRKMRRDNVNLPFATNPRAARAAAAKVKSEQTPKKTSPVATPFETGLGEFLYREGI
jgi:hypothetical protein